MTQAKKIADYAIEQLQQIAADLDDHPDASEFREDIKETIVPTIREMLKEESQKPRLRHFSPSDVLDLATRLFDSHAGGWSLEACIETAAERCAQAEALCAGPDDKPEGDDLRAEVDYLLLCLETLARYTVQAGLPIGLRSRGGEWIDIEEVLAQHDIDL